MTHKTFTLAAAMVVAVAVPTAAEARSQMRAVGSSTVYPFAKAVAERVARANPGSARRSLSRPGQAPG